MPFELHSIFESLSALFAQEGFLICVLPEVLVVIPLIRITVVAFAAFVHYTAMGALMLYQVTFMCEVLITEGLLTFVFLCIAVADNAMV